MPEKFDHQNLIKWFKREKRDLPWRKNPTPYEVWISEVMLQQTQVAIVIPYYERWMRRFPSIESLAAAPIEEVIKLWEGLGYYSRARNLHEGARQVMKNFNGKLPDDPESLKKIKGLGDYTVGAIMNFAFHKRCPAVDGNVKRVMARYFMIEEDISKSKTQKQIHTLAGEILPQEESWIVSEALIELGATICQRKPSCKDCPLRKSCGAFIAGAAHRLPFKSARSKTEYLYRAVAILECENAFLVRRVREGEIMSGLHEFPYIEASQEGLDKDELLRQVKMRFGLACSFKMAYPAIAHSFTRFNVILYPYYLHCAKPVAVKDFMWMSLQELEKVAFPSGHRTIFHNLKTKC